MHAGNLPQTGHDLFQMFEVGDVEDDFHAGLAVGSMRPNISYIALSITNNTSNAFKHTEAVVAVDRQLDRVGRGSALVAGPLHIDPALRFVHQVRDVGAIHRVHSHALAAGDVADNAFSADRTATARAVDQHIALALH